MITFISDIRSLTISAVCVKRKWKRSVKPKLTLSGDWMEKAGFGVGEKVTISVSDNKMIISKAYDF